MAHRGTQPVPDDSDEEIPDEKGGSDEPDDDHDESDDDDEQCQPLPLPQDHHSSDATMEKLESSMAAVTVGKKRSSCDSNATKKVAKAKSWSMVNGGSVG